jgi:rhodanese-related sulfurtransferase
VRTPKEYTAGHLSGAINLDYYSNNFRTDLEQLDKSKTYLIYCRTGRRSGVTLNMMRELGFSGVYDIAGGIKAWLAKGLPYLN